MPDRKARILRDLDADCIAPAIPAKPENVHQGGATPIAVRVSRRLRELRGGYSDDEGCKAMPDAACRFRGAERSPSGARAAIVRRRESGDGALSRRRGGRRPVFSMSRNCLRSPEPGLPIL